jgi:hypothetical protein
MDAQKFKYDRQYINELDKVLNRHKKVAEWHLTEVI